MSLLIKPPKEDHIPHLPAYYHIFRLLQLILAIIILALTSYALTNTSSGYSAFAMFTAVATLVLLVYSAVTLVFYTVLYNRIAVLVADCLAIVAWLAAFASMATWARDISQLDDIHCKGDETCLSSNTRNSHLTATAVAASLGVLEFFLFIITLTIYSLQFHRLRVSGAPYTQTGIWVAPREPAITPTGATMEKTFTNPIMAPIPEDRVATGVETVVEDRVRPLVTTAGVPKAEGFEQQETYVGDGAGKGEIRHSGTFFIDDGVVEGPELVVDEGRKIVDRVA